MLQPVKFINRYTLETETETIPHEKGLRLLYEFPVGGTLSLYLAVKRLWFSSWYGRLKKSSLSKNEISKFVETYGLDPSEFEKQMNTFENFNDFFVRRLKAQSRPIRMGEENAVFPCDGRHSVFQSLSEIEGVFVKGQFLDLGGLLEDQALAETYQNGSMVISRLAPQDYHRFHFPIDCTASSSKLIHGDLYSVNPIALRKNINYLVQNKRRVTRLKTDIWGEVLMLEIGATFVGSIKQTYSPDTQIRKGAEKGYFEIGGSMIILLFEPGRITFSPDLVSAMEKGMELYARCGDLLGTIRKPSEGNRCPI
ncbi:MAG: phosphatidylserine decarboxylase [Candidatus Lindowbacteria bacterium]|nr:phosphatidylserine decarboxylase [Candidatus Lindowbacteria bacterium]